MLTAAPAWAHEHFYDVTLSGAGLSASTASGTALVTLDLDLITVRIEATFAGLLGGAVGMQLHCCTALPGSGTAMGALAQPVMPGFPTGVSSGAFDITYDLTEDATYSPGFVVASGGHTSDALNALINGAAAGAMYLSIRSSAFPEGEIRGFLIEQAEVVPEPGTCGLMLGGLAAIGALARQRRGA
jgi:hypothetical protein